MRIKEEIERTFIADDGTEFETEELCYEHEMIAAHIEVGKSTKYVLGHFYNDGTAYMRKYKRKEYKNGKVAYYDNGGTCNVKYAYKFDSFEEAYNVAGNRVMTMEAANKASEIYIAKAAKKKVREQRYICEYDKTPGPDGEYITNLGMVWYQNGAGWEKLPEFWMRKVNLTSR